MQRKLSVRILASLILSVMLFALPIGAFLANDSATVPVFAEESVSGNSTGEASGTGDENTGDTSGESGNTDDGSDSSTDDGSTGDSSSDSGDTGTGDTGDTGETEDPTPTPEPEEPAVCICTSKCGQYDYNKDCPVCSEDYTKCAYKNPSVKITINAPSGWYSSGTTAKVTFKAEDIADSGHFAIKSVKAKIGQNGSYQDVTEDMYLEISEN